MIPPLDDGVLPEGIHDCTLAEIEETFGRFQRTDRRIRLCEKLKAYLAEARSVSFIQAIIVDGSFVTAKEEPEDIDLIVVLKPDFDRLQELKPFEYNTISKRALRSAGFPFDLYAFTEGSEKYREYVELFSQTSPEKHRLFTSRARKGMLRIIP